MSTNFLNRRMDLLHSVSTNTNYLTMDTSYPVKIAGKILKLFTAANTFNTNNWTLQNTENKPILTFSVYHLRDDFYKLIDFIENLVPNEYKYYFRQYRYTPTETVCYAIPSNRQKK